MAADSTEVVYAPGACNIAHDEVAFRRKFGFVGLGLTVAIAAALFALDAPFWAFFFLAIPAALTAIGFIQAQESFCVRYASEGRYNIAPGYEDRGKVTDEIAHQADMAKARSMNIRAAAIGIAVAAVLAVLSTAV